jgi:hypothetical protein
MFGTNGENELFPNSDDEFAEAQTPSRRLA